MITIERTITKVALLLLVFSIIELAGYPLATAETKVEEIVGEIVSIDITTNILIVKTRNGEISIAVNEKTQVTTGKEQKQFSDLKPGEKVKVHYTIAEGEELAERIMVRPLRKKDSMKGALDQ